MMLNESDDRRDQTLRSEHGELTANTPATPPHGSRIAQSHLVVPIVHAGRTILIDMNGGHRIALDAFGNRVWQSLADQPTLPVLIERLRDEGTRAERIAEDVVRLLAKWREESVIAWR
jgi:hypothetical protein